MISVPPGWGVPKKPAAAAAAGVINPDTVDENGQPNMPTGGIAQPSMSDGGVAGVGQKPHAALPAIADPTAASTNTAGVGAGAALPTSSTQVQPNSATIAPIPGGAGAVANPGETLAQTAARYKADYHSQDADAVNAALDKLLHPSAAGPAAGTEDYSTPASQLSSLAALIQQGGGWDGTTPEYFQQRIMETGGFTPGNVAYWKNMILGGKAAHDASEAGGGGQAAAQSGGGQYSDVIHQSILKLLDRGFSPVDPNDPQIAGPTTAFRNQATYGANRNREALAERAAQEGMGSGAFDSAVQSGNEKAAMDTASYSGNLQVQELQARRNDIANALQFAQGEDAQALSLQLARMDDQIKRMSLSQNQSQFVDTQNYDLGKDDATFNYLYAQLAGS